MHRQSDMPALIPLGDASERPAHVPVATIGLIVVNAAVFWLELTGGDGFVLRWAMVPADHRWITLLTSMFMHGSWSHIIGNMIFLWAFAPQVEEAMGPWRYLAFYLSGGVVAMLAQLMAATGSTVPMLGASGAIAAVMGAFLVTYPRHEIRVVLMFFVFVRVAFVPAAVLIGVWFLVQLLNLGAVANVETGGVAYVAHVAGLIYGAITARLFEDPRRLAAQGG